MIFAENYEEELTEDLPIFREYEIDFKTKRLTGRILEGAEALKIWAWSALQTARYRYYIYSTDYGVEYEELIGTLYTEEYTASEIERMTEECLLVNEYITGIDQFEHSFSGNILHVKFKMNTIYGEEEFEADV